MITPIDKALVDGLVAELGIKDFAKATIREVKQVAAKAEKASGVEFIRIHQSGSYQSSNKFLHVQ